MKQLISQSRKFLSSKSPRHQAPYFLSIVIGGILIASVSCRLRQEFSAKTLPAAPADTLDFVYQENPQAPHLLLAQLDRRYCDTSSTGQETWFYRIATVFGEHKAQVNYAFAASGEAIQTNVDGSSFLAPLDHPIPAADLRQACVKAQEENSKQIVVNNPTVLEETQKVLQNLAPSCEFGTPDPQGVWHCKLKGAEPQQTLAKLQDIKQDMVQRWSRHPYLLIRRVAVASSLASALTKDNTEHLDKFCRHLSFSLPEELPLSLRTHAWQQNVCKAPTKDRVEVAKIGLTDALAEINFLKQDLENSSRLGTLALRIPYSEDLSRDFWITLSPLPMDQLDPVTEARLQAGSVCWHPLYAENSSFSSTAAQIGIVAQEKSAKCQQNRTQVDDALKIPSNYVISSITSESEFPITNGQAKLLRLPEGQYEYIIKEHLPEDPWGENGTPVKVSQGVVDWRSKRPRPVISRWEQQPLVTAPKPDDAIVPASLQQKEAE